MRGAAGSSLTAGKYMQYHRRAVPDQGSGIARSQQGRATLVAALLFPAATRTASHLDRRERALVEAVAAHDAEAQALLARVVDVNSGTHNFAGVREVGRIFGYRLAALGFTTRWADGAAFGRAGHLIAD